MGTGSGRDLVTPVPVIGKVSGPEPPVGSDMEKAERISPFSSGQRYFSFWASVP